jgi:hypothetical protein
MCKSITHSKNFKKYLEGRLPHYIGINTALEGSDVVLAMLD